MTCFIRAFLYVFVALAAFSAPAAAAQMQCAGPGLSIVVDVNAPAGTCAINGRQVALRKPHDPVVCHIANPQLRILTIRTDGAFVWEDTDSARIVRGTCSPG